MGSILTETKQTLGLGDDATGFEPELILFINGVLSNLNQLGIGPDEGFAIEDAGPTWEDFLGTDKRLNDAKLVMHYGVKLVFDPPQQAPVIMSMEKLRDEAVWRLNVQREEILHPPIPNSGVLFVNPYDRDAVVRIDDGRITSIEVDGVDQGALYGTFVVPATKAIKVTYTEAPTWRWS